MGEARGETRSGISPSKIFAGLLLLSSAFCCVSATAFIAVDPSGHRALSEQVEKAKRAFPGVHPRPALRDETPSEVSAPLRRSVDPDHNLNTIRHTVILRRCFEASLRGFGPQCNGVDELVSQNADMVRAARLAIRGDRVATPPGFPTDSFEVEASTLVAVGRMLIGQTYALSEDGYAERARGILDGVRITEDANLGRGLNGLALIAETTQGAAFRLGEVVGQMTPELARATIDELTALLEHRVPIGQFMETSVIRTCEAQLAVYDTRPIPFVARLRDEFHVYPTAEVWCTRPSDFRVFENTFEDARRLVAEAARRSGTLTAGAIDPMVREPDDVIRAFMRGNERMRLVLTALRLMAGGTVAEAIAAPDVRGMRREPQVSWRNDRVCLSHEPYTARHRTREVLRPHGWGGGVQNRDRLPYSICLPRDAIDETGAPPPQARRTSRRRRGNEVLTPR